MEDLKKYNQDNWNVICTTVIDPDEIHLWPVSLHLYVGDHGPELHLVELWGDTDVKVTLPPEKLRELVQALRTIEALRGEW
jgi:hypothetical protein